MYCWWDVDIKIKFTTNTQCKTCGLGVPGLYDSKNGKCINIVLMYVLLFFAKVFFPPKIAERS